MVFLILANSWQLKLYMEVKFKNYVSVSIPYHKKTVGGLKLNI